MIDTYSYNYTIYPNEKRVYYHHSGCCRNKGTLLHVDLIKIKRKYCESHLFGLDVSK